MKSGGSSLGSRGSWPNLGNLSVTSVGASISYTPKLFVESTSARWYSTSARKINCQLWYSSNQAFPQVIHRLNRCNCQSSATTLTPVLPLVVQRGSRQRKPPGFGQYRGLPSGHTATAHFLWRHRGAKC